MDWKVGWFSCLRGYLDTMKGVWRNTLLDLDHAKRLPHDYLNPCKFLFTDNIDL